MPLVLTEAMILSPDLVQKKGNCSVGTESLNRCLRRRSGHQPDFSSLGVPRMSRAAFGMYTTFLIMKRLKCPPVSERQIPVSNPLAHRHRFAYYSSYARGVSAQVVQLAFVSAHMYSASTID